MLSRWQSESRRGVACRSRGDPAVSIRPPTERLKGGSDGVLRLRFIRVGLFF